MGTLSTGRPGAPNALAALVFRARKLLLKSARIR
jgi:hypothetical protein